MITEHYISENCLCYKMRSASRTITRIYDEQIKSTGIKANQFSMLVAIKVMDSVSISSLAKQLMMERTTLTRNLTPLEKLQLISIRAGEGRTRNVSLTSEGLQKVEDVKPLWKQAQQKIENALGQEESALLSNLSSIINNLAEKHI